MRALRDIASTRRVWAWPYVLLLVLFVVLPMLLIVYYAFTTTDGDFTIANFVKFFNA